MPTRPAAAGATIRDRLRVARGRRFVGREAELELFREAVEAAEPEFVVLWIHGPGGVGKTTLLEAFADVAAAAGVEPLRLDMRAVEPAPPAFGAALAEAAGVAAGDDPVEAFADGSPRVLLLDTYEVAAPLDGWLRDSFLPELPARTIVVVAGRTPPGEEWVIDAGWRDAVRAVSLCNLDRNDARAFLRVSGVDEALHDVEDTRILEDAIDITTARSPIRERIRTIFVPPPPRTRPRQLQAEEAERWRETLKARSG